MKLLKELSYFATGGSCQRLYEPTDIASLAHALREVAQEALPLFFLGGGSNSLVSDEPWQGAVISFHRMQRLEFDGNRVICGAGVDNSHLVRECLQKNLAGVGWMYRLPGQLGATVRMNARCYGGEISQVVTCVRSVTRDGQVKEYRDPGVFRGYKNTVFMENSEAIAEIELTLEKGDPQEIQMLMEHCERDRSAKGQFDYPSCGCVFKNDYTVGVPSGLLLEMSGAKNLVGKNAIVSPGHANFVYNQGAGSRDILELTLAMRETVYQYFGAWMEYEMEMLGTFPDTLLQKVLEKRPMHLHPERIAEARKRFQLK